MKNPKLLWLIPPVCGIISASFIYALMFSGVANDSVAHFLHGTFRWVFSVILALDLGPHGCDGMIWLAFAPGIAWFLFGTFLGGILAIVVFLRLKRSGQLPQRVNYRQVAAEIKCRPEYEYFILEDPERRYLYSEQLPLEFNKWLQQRPTTNKCEQDVPPNA